MQFSVFMAVVFAAAVVVTYKPRPRLRQARYRDTYKYEPPVHDTYRAPPPVEPQEFTEEDQAALTKRMSAEDTETLYFFKTLNKEDEPDSAEITDLRNFNIRQGWRPKSDTAVPTLTGTVVQEVPAEQEVQDDAWGPGGPSASYEEWVAEGRAEADPEWYCSELNLEEPDLLRDGVEVTMRKLALKCFGHVPELESSSA